MSNRDSASWNSIINGYVRVGDVDTAHRIFYQMPMKNVGSWNIMISGYLNKAHNPGYGLKLFREMIKMGVRGTDTTFVVVLTACGRLARLKEDKSVHGSMIKNFGMSTLIIKIALKDMYSKCRRVDAARRVFDSVLVRNIVSWNAMILGYCIHGCPDDSISLFHEMTGIMHYDDDYGGGRKERKISKAAEQLVIPYEITFIGVLCACARGGLLSDGRTSILISKTVEQKNPMVFLSNCELEKFSLAISSKESNSNVSLAILRWQVVVLAGGYSVVSVCWLVCVCGGDVRCGVGGRWFSGVVFGVCRLVSVAASCMLPPSCDLDDLADVDLLCWCSSLMLMLPAVLLDMCVICNFFIMSTFLCNHTL
ncbi:hypothetical protein IFM89_000427 [Coptis chinensis]|uniref:Pentatricopeptide repeat-containing protein n=1 Tax=Coptis chinensis TaxID=261450 RepID=A0A835LYS1_9MAGN|nr:hypothetical protein IFM89_000427 [Coptis chinensis]